MLIFDNPVSMLVSTRLPGLPLETSDFLAEVVDLPVVLLLDLSSLEPSMVKSLSDLTNSNFFLYLDFDGNFVRHSELTILDIVRFTLLNKRYLYLGDRWSMSLLFFSLKYDFWILYLRRLFFQEQRRPIDSHKGVLTSPYPCASFKSRICWFKSWSLLPSLL